MNNVHFAIPEIYGETLSYYELLRKLVDKTNELIENYNTVPEQIAEEVANLDASQLFSAVLNQLIHSIATDNTKSANAVKVYKKHDLLYATFNETVNLYESLIDFTTGTETELIVGSNIREVNISDLFIELRKLIYDEVQARDIGDTTLQQAINTETANRNNDYNRLTEKINNGVLKIDKLWQNSSISSPFAPQTITLDLSKYKFVQVLFKMATDESYVECAETLPFTDNTQLTSMFQSYSSSFGGFTAFREIVNVKKTGINFGEAKQVTSISSYSTNNNLMIPYIIYGVR